MKKTILLFALFCSFYAGAQEITVSKPEQLMKGTNGEAFYPVLNNDGSKLLYTSGNYSGLKMYDFASQASSTISDLAFAGYQAKFTVDNGVYYTVKEPQTLTKNVMRYDIASANNTTVMSGERNILTISALKNGVVLKSERDMKTVGSNKGYYVYTAGSKVIVGKNGVEKAFSPVKSEAGYLWSSLSPDGTKVLFFAAGSGIVVMDINGNLIKQLGNYEAPVWYGNDYVVAQNAKDDGHQFSSSQIIMMKVDGSMTKEITRPTSMTMFPTASAVAGKIVYNTIDGKIFMVNITIK